MPLRNALLIEFREEAALTRKMLERVPFANPEWKPHEKSMTLQRLASHIAEIPFWMMRALHMDGMDFGQPGALPPRFYAKDSEELLQKFESSHREASEALEKATDEALDMKWIMRRGGQVIYALTKMVVIRKWVFNHTIHHRGQLSVYLRLNNVPVPGMYGPSADEKNG